MANHLVLISNRKDDVEFFSRVTYETGLSYHALDNREDLKTILIDFPQSIVVLDADHLTSSEAADPMSLEALGKVMKDFINPFRVYVITDKTINHYPTLFKNFDFSHHIYRKYDDNLRELFPYLLRSTLVQNPFGLERFFPEDIKPQKIILKKGKQKNAAVEATQNFLTKSGVAKRLSAQVAQAVDELLMNALYDAPVSADGKRYRVNQDRSQDFDLSVKEQVEFHLAIGSQYVAVSVSDNFGSLDKAILFALIKKDYQKEKYVVNRAKVNAGLGIHGIVQGGLSIIYVSKPGNKTEAILLFPKTGSFKAFRESFQFMSIFSE